MRELGRVQQPPEERLRLARAPEVQEGLERECRVAHPAEAVVPVALAADLLGQRRGRRRRDRPGGRVEEQLERQRAADHGIAPRAVVRTLRGPAPPVGGQWRPDVARPARASGRRAAPGGPRTARSAPSWTRVPRTVRRSPRRRSAPRPPPRSTPPLRHGLRRRPGSGRDARSVAAPRRIRRPA